MMWYDERASRELGSLRRWRHRLFLVLLAGWLIVVSLQIALVFLAPAPPTWSRIATVVSVSIVSFCLGLVAGMQLREQLERTR
jgi:hypothetical protein